MYQNSTYLPVGFKSCSVTAVDDHTNNVYKTASTISGDIIKITQKDLKNKELDNTQVEIEYDARNSLELEDIQLISKSDRVSPVFTMKQPETKSIGAKILKNIGLTNEYTDIYYTLKFTGKYIHGKRFLEFQGTLY